MGRVQQWWDGLSHTPRKSESSVLLDIDRCRGRNELFQKGSIGLPGGREQLFV